MRPELETSSGQLQGACDEKAAAQGTGSLQILYAWVGKPEHVVRMHMHQLC